MGKPTVQEVRSRCPDVEQRLVREHIERLDASYFQRFGAEQVAEHIRRLSRLNPRHPVEVVVETVPERRVSVTVLAMDYPSVFSLITGTLAGMGFNIESGDVFTYGRAEPAPMEPVGAAHRRRFGRHRRHRPHRPRAPAAGGRRIIDCFVGRIPDAEAPVEPWAEALRRRLNDVIGRLAGGDSRDIDAAKQQVNEMVTARLAEIPTSQDTVLYPVELDVARDSGPFTRLRVVSQDTPAFLYALSTALSLHNLIIERVRIRTVDHRIEDEIDLVDQRGNPVADPETLDKVRLSVLLTKQFTYFLSKAPDPYSALSRFEKLTEDILNLPESGRWVQQLSNPRTMQDLARLFGASDYLWEDFIRLQYEALLPMLRPHVTGRRFSAPTEQLAEQLDAALAEADSPAEKRKVLNRFKDRHIFLIDLDHILTPGSNFRVMAERLTALAELVVRTAARLVHGNMVETYGLPRTADGEPAVYTVFGLGKLGGAALGYASDIELLFVYSDNGRTDGPRRIETARFFERMVEEISRFIEAKQEGIFRVDLRLRPFGKDGPLACGLEAFDRYYSPGGEAHAMERLALVRMRAIGGDSRLGRRVEQVRDRHLYEHPEALNLADLRAVRRKAYQEKAVGATFNAKHGCGGLADLEYGVQTLQVLHGKQHPELRTPRIHQALDVLARIGGLGESEAASVNDAYQFLRRLINGLRMLRGNALDLFLPAFDSDEFVHLARRMGYQKQGSLSPARQLHLDFDLATASVRTFARRHFGRDALPEPDLANIADLLLQDDPEPAVRDRTLSDLGFKDPAAALRHLRKLADAAGDRRLISRVALLAAPALHEQINPDRALSRWAESMAGLDHPGGYFESLRDDETLVRVLIGILARTDRAAALLIRLPRLIQWLASPRKLLEEDHLAAVEDALGAGQEVG